jgi:hypothetical protein
MRKYKNLSKQKMAEKEKELAAAIAEITAELEAMQVTFTYIHTYIHTSRSYFCSMYVINIKRMYVCMYVLYVLRIASSAMRIKSMINVCMCMYVQLVCVNVCMNVCIYVCLYECMCLFFSSLTCMPPSGTTLCKIDCEMPAMN